MTRPTQGRVAAGELRPPASQVRTSCGFCEPGHGQAPGVCRDAGGHCRDNWPHFVRATSANPDGSWTCACSAAGHATWLGRCAASPSRACWPGPPGTSQPWRGPWPPRPRHHPARSPGPGGGARRRPARRTGALPASRWSQSRRIARPARSSTLGTASPVGRDGKETFIHAGPRRPERVRDGIAAISFSGSPADRPARRRGWPPAGTGRPGPRDRVHSSLKERAGVRRPCRRSRRAGAQVLPGCGDGDGG